MHARNEGDPAFKIDREPTPLFTGVFVDDQRGFGEAFAQPFQGIPSFRIQIIEPSESEELHTDLQEAQLEIALSRINPTEISLLIVDQSVDSHYLRSPMETFIKRVRRSNPSAWILEVSGDVRRKIFPESNNAVEKYDLFKIFMDKIEPLPLSAARLDRLKYETSEAFLQAGMSDHRDQDPRSQDDLLSERSKQMAEKHPNYSQALVLMGINPENFDNRFRISKEQEKILHGLWSIIGHLEMGHPPEFYSLPLDRLKALLKD